jgi:ATPase subunit of ABC transporter with duplicated ATPase domains
VGREILYRYITTTAATLVVVSHDRVLLNLLSKVYELAKGGVTVYGGNYDFYAEQKAIERHALDSAVQARAKELRKAKEVERAALERQQKLDARGKKKQEKAGLPTILMKTFKNSGEKTIARLKGAHADKVNAMSRELSELREDLPAIDEMKIDFDNSPLHRGKILVTAEGVNFKYDDYSLWPLPLDFKIVSGERIAVRGRNGSGKTTLIKLIMGELSPSAGVIVRADASTLYIDQNYSLLDESLTVYEQAQRFNSGGLQEHEVKIRLNRFLFGKAHWDKPCYALSGGERMRLILCALAIRSKAPDMLILDEPTNNLDIQNVQILTKAINEYEGTVLVISHDDYFVKEISVDRFLDVGACESQ